MLQKTTWLLLVVALGLSLIACSSQPTYEDDDEYTDVDIPPLYQYVHQPTDAGFQETRMDLNGRTVTIVTDSIHLFVNPNPNIELIHTPSFINEQILRTIEYDYNMQFVFEAAPVPAGDLADALLMNRQIPLEWDIIHVATNRVSLDRFILNQLFIPLCHPAISHVVSIDIENNPWSPETQMTNILGHQFGVSFPLMSEQFLPSAIIFNRTYMEAFLLPNFYEMAFNLTWNFDNFERILRDVATTSNVIVHPFVAERESAIVPFFIASNNGTVTEIMPNGDKTFVAHQNQNTIEAMEFLARLYQDNLLQIDADSAINWVASGETMFISGNYDILRRFTRQETPTPYRFGLLPIPLGNQRHWPSSYVTSSHTSHQWFIVNDIQRPAEVAAVLVAMANRLSPISIDSIIANELNYGLQDLESAEILQMLLQPERWVIDHSRISGIPRFNLSQAINAILNGKIPPQQAFEQISEQIQQHYDSLRP